MYFSIVAAKFSLINLNNKTNTSERKGIVTYRFFQREASYERWGLGGLAPVTFLGEKSWKFFNILKLSTQSIQNPAFRKCIYILGIFDP